MNNLKKYKLTIISAFCFGLILPLSLALSPAGQWIGNTVSGIGDFLADGSIPMTGDLDTGNQDIKMGTGLIGYDGTASKGLQFDSGNEKLTLLSGQFIFPAGTAAAPPIGWTDTGFHEPEANIISITLNGSRTYSFLTDKIASHIADSFKIMNEASTSTNPIYCFAPDEGTGTGRGAMGQPNVVGNSLEAQRWIPKADVDSDNNDVFLTGVSGFHGVVWVISLTDNTSAQYRVSNVTVVDVSLDGDHTSTKDTGSHYNFYYESDQFKLQNKVGDNKSIQVQFWVLPT